ncbi:MAG: hypothetical protein JW882_09950 [Deltaproteobacteria bacterium]|nr:hypothetical protein [Deltaproteobacteria bacterium]
MNDVMQFISDNRAWIMSGLLIIAGLGLWRVIYDMFDQAEQDLRDMTEEWEQFRERFRKLRGKLQ